MLVIVLGGTFAWFTYNNKIVNTNVATTRTSEDTLELYVSSKGGAEFTEGKQADLVQISKANIEDLMPVSTADLKTFLYSTSTKDGKATTFAQDAEGSMYYQGRVFLKAVNSGKAKGNGLDLYLDVSDGPLVEAGEGSEGILKVARLGLSFNEGEKVVIFEIDNTPGSDEHTVYTYINGVRIGANQVITLKDGKVVAVDSPAIDPKYMSITIVGDEVKLPISNLIKLRFNEIYSVDAFFYLEGCDPECSDDISFEDITMHLAFYGVLN